jgi:spore coat protein U-like protein
MGHENQPNHSEKETIMKQLNKVLLSAVLATLTSAAFAADQADVKVTAAVVNNCKITATEDINFGQLDPAAATDQSAKGAVSFKCTKSADYTVTADNGANWDAKAGKRQMKGAADNFLPYALAQASFTGKGSGFSTPITVALNASLSGTDYKDLSADSYADVLRVTIAP